MDKYNFIELHVEKIEKSLGRKLPEEYTDFINKKLYVKYNKEILDRDSQDGDLTVLFKGEVNVTGLPELDSLSASDKKKYLPFAYAEWSSGMPGYYILADITGSTICPLHEFYLGDIDDDPLFASIGAFIKAIEKKKKDVTIKKLEELYNIKISSKEYTDFIKNKDYKKYNNKTFHDKKLSFDNIGVFDNIWDNINELNASAKTSVLPFASFQDVYHEENIFLVIDISQKEKSAVLLWNDDCFEHVADSIGDFLKHIKS
jgi:hypothetical protein